MLSWLTLRRQRTYTSLMGSKQRLTLDEVIISWCYGAQKFNSVCFTAVLLILWCCSLQVERNSLDFEERWACCPCPAVVLLLALFRTIYFKTKCCLAGSLQHSWGLRSLSWGSSKCLELLRGSSPLYGGAGEGLCDVKDLQWILFYSSCKQNWDQSEIHFSAGGGGEGSFMGRSDLLSIVGVQFWMASLGSGS